MKNLVLVDSSVWIEYFKGGIASLGLDELLDNDAVCVNELILTELIPSILHKGEKELRDLMASIPRLKIKIDWPNLRKLQLINFKNGINNIGIPDLIIAQNALANAVELFSLDRDFHRMSQVHDLRLYNPSNL
ncbi:MAG: PIN domain-containing protein [Spirochaetia bacterium]|nr:PIN domain-containing protein [Spirochaetia bacterium]